MPPSPDRSSTSTTLDTVVAGPAADWETVCSLLQETNSRGKKMGLWILVAVDDVDDVLIIQYISDSAYRYMC